MNLEHRTALPLAASPGCCCAPAGSAPKAPAAVVIPRAAAAETSDADASAATLRHLPQ